MKGSQAVYLLRSLGKNVSDDLAEGLEFDELLTERRVEFEIVGTAKGSKAVAVRPAT